MKKVPSSKTFTGQILRYLQKRGFTWEVVDIERSSDNSRIQVTAPDGTVHTFVNDTGKFVPFVDWVIGLAKRYRKNETQGPS